MGEVYPGLKKLAHGPTLYEQQIVHFCEDLRYIIEAPRELWAVNHPMVIFSKWVKFFMAPHVQGDDLRVLANYVFSELGDLRLGCAGRASILTRKKQPDWFYCVQDLGRAFMDMCCSIRAFLMYDFDMAAQKDPHARVMSMYNINMEAHKDPYELVGCFFDKLEDLIVYMFLHGSSFRTRLQRHAVAKAKTQFVVQRDIVRESVRKIREARLERKQWKTYVATLHQAEGAAAPSIGLSEADMDSDAGAPYRDEILEDTDASGRPRDDEEGDGYAYGAKIRKFIASVARPLKAPFEQITSDDRMKLSEFYTNMELTKKLSVHFWNKAFEKLTEQQFCDVACPKELVEDLFFVTKIFKMMYETATDAGADDETFTVLFKTVSDKIARKPTPPFVASRADARALDSISAAHGGGAEGSTFGDPAPDTVESVKRNTTRALFFVAGHRGAAVSFAINALLERYAIQQPSKRQVAMFLKDIGFSASAMMIFYNLYVAHRYFSDPVYFQQHDPETCRIVSNPMVRETVMGMKAPYSDKFLAYWNAFSSAGAAEGGPPASVVDDDMSDSESEDEDEHVPAWTSVGPVSYTEIERIKNNVEAARAALLDATWWVGRSAFAPMLDYFFRTNV